MIKIELLKYHPEFIPMLIKIWHDGIGKTWLPDICIDRVKDKLSAHLNENTLPLTFVAYDDNLPVGMCSLRENDGIMPELTPWLGSLVVEKSYRNKGIGSRLIASVIEKAKAMGYDTLYLFVFDQTLINFYESIGWEIIGTDKFSSHPITVMRIKYANGID